MTTATSWVDRNMSRLMALAIGGTMLCFAGYGYLQVQVRGQASQGAQARTVQCKVRPIQIQQERWFHASGVISYEELQQFIAALPSPKQCAELQKP